MLPFYFSYASVWSIFLFLLYNLENTHVSCYPLRISAFHNSMIVLSFDFFSIFAIHIFVALNNNSGKDGKINSETMQKDLVFWIRRIFFLRCMFSFMAWKTKTNELNKKKGNRKREENHKIFFLNELLHIIHGISWGISFLSFGISGSGMSGIR